MLKCNNYTIGGPRQEQPYYFIKLQQTINFEKQKKPGGKTRRTKIKNIKLQAY